jgi:D-serine deaminase-like pyridoxal phosphate-dependent protein
VEADHNQGGVSQKGPTEGLPPAPSGKGSGEDEARAPSVLATPTAVRLDTATVALDPPFAIVDLDAFEANAEGLAARAGKPIRVASKSVRCRELLRTVLSRPGFHGLMAYTLPEAIWLVRTGVTDDVLMGYPIADRSALADLVADERLANAITLMIDSSDQLDLIDAVIAPGRRPVLRICLDLDASWRPWGLAHIGVRRSPLHTPEAIGDLAATVANRAGFRLVGVMSYEAQIAGLGDAPLGRPIYGRMLRLVQARSYQDLLVRRAAAVAKAREHSDLEFVNGGGTGSLVLTAADPAVTEVTAGSGLYGPTLFDAYRSWRPVPAAYFALSVVRRPGPGLVTVHGGGWIASGPSEATRLPRPVLPRGLSLLATEGAGEVQTPLTGAAADALRVGDRVWFRHAKAGELCEHVDTLHLIRGEAIERSVPTYRGDHAPAFL